MTARLVFLMRDMDCAEEIGTLRRELGGVPGVGELAFDLLGRRLTVEVHPSGPSSEALLAILRRTGMTAEPWVEGSASPAQAGHGKQWRALSTALSGTCVVAGLAWQVSVDGWGAALGTSATSAGPPLAARAAYAVAAAAGAWFVLPKAYLALRRLRPDMNLLMCIAVAGAIGIGEWLEAAAVSFLFALSLALEAWSTGRARHAIAALMALSPTRARVLDADGSEQFVEAAGVASGALLLVKPGEKFPLDGTVTRGRTTVNQAAITGESAAVPKDEGDQVFAGTLNEDGSVQVRVDRPFADSTLAQIARLVGEAHSRRSPSEQWVERFARIYTPLVMVAAVLVALATPSFGGAWSAGLYRGLVLLVIACPCALVISTPVSIIAGLAAAARQGVLVKGGVFLERPARIRAMAFDKTGTLTRGRPEVVEVVPGPGRDQRELLGIALSIAVQSSHPLSGAIARHATAKGLRPVPVTDFQSLPGRGARARIGGTDCWLASHRDLEERGLESPETHGVLERLAATGASVVVVGQGAEPCGYIALADRLRPEAPVALQALKDLGIRPLILLTGDNRATAAAIAVRAGIDEVRAELLPQEKVAAIEEMAARYGPTAMVGDGINDTPALARSDLGIAMGVAGSDAALETADIALMGDDLTRLPWLVRHSRRTLRIIRQNIAASLAVKGVFVVLSLTGHATLWAAIAADMGVSFAVVLNALRLARPASLARPSPPA